MISLHKTGYTSLWNDIIGHFICSYIVVYTRTYKYIEGVGIPDESIVPLSAARPGSVPSLGRVTELS